VDNQAGKDKEDLIVFEAEHLYEYFKKDAISSCHDLLKVKINTFLKQNNIVDESSFTLSKIEDTVTIEWMLDEYSCKCKQYLKLK